jgi:hypothetical protein
MKRFTISLMFVLSLLLAVGSNDLKTGNVFGDLNGDDEVNVADINVLIDIILGGGNNPTPDPNAPNMTIAEFKAKHWQDARNYVDTVTKDEVIHGWVTSSDEAGNIYKTLYITDESDAGLAISIDKRDLYNDYPIGQEIILPMKGYYVGKYNGQQVIGYPQWYAAGNTWEATFMPADMWESLAKKNGTADPDRPEVQPVDVSLGDFMGNSDSETLREYQGRLVRIADVSFEDADGVTTFSEDTHATNRWIFDSEGNRMIVRTSNYADFKDMVLPKGKVEIVGLLTTYGTQWQLQMRNADDVTVTGESESGEVLTWIEEGFDNTIPNIWSKVIVSGDKNWYQTLFMNNGYAAMTGYRGTNPPFDAWLITPALDIKNATGKTLSFRTEVNAYGSTTTQFEVYLLNALDPSVATVKVKLNPVLATAPTYGYSDWTDSGELDLSQWSDGVYYIGFRYYATQDNNYATWCLDDVKFGI